MDNSVTLSNGLLSEGYTDRDIEPPVALLLQKGLADTAVEQKDIDPTRDVIGQSKTRKQLRPSKPTSNRIPLILRPKDTERSQHTSQKLSRATVKGAGPARLMLRRTGKRP